MECKDISPVPSNLAMEDGVDSALDHGLEGQLHRDTTVFHQDRARRSVGPEMNPVAPWVALDGRMRHDGSGRRKRKH